VKDWPWITGAVVVAFTLTVAFFLFTTILQ
jgi:hypothetical protein